MNKLAMKQQVIILIAVFVLMVALFYVFAWSPQTARLAELDQQRAAEETKLDAAKSTLTMLVQVRKTASESEFELVKVRTKMPSEPQLPTLIVSLQNIADDAGVALLSITPGEPASQGAYGEIAISTSVSGSYVSIIDFLKRLEKASRELRVNTINVAGGTTYPDLAVKLTMSAYTMNDTTQTAPAAPAQSAAVPQTPTAAN
ncbi:MAG: type IV pilus inner membrane component PilO [Candidatus Aquicultor sp.]